VLFTQVDSAKSPLFTDSSSASNRQTDRQTDGQTGGKAISIAEHLSIQTAASNTAASARSVYTKYINPTSVK